MAILLVRRARVSILALAFLSVFSIGTQAQTLSPVSAQPTASPSPTPTPSLEKRFFHNILKDQKAIWLSPFSLERSDVKWIAPLGITTAFLITTDRSTTAELVEHGDDVSRLKISHGVSQLGEFYTTGGIAAAFYFAGRAKNNPKAKETGLLSAEALIDSGIVVNVLKLVSQRGRPTVDNGRGDFIDSGSSFPSGHAASAWSLATVVAKEYKHRGWVKWTAYGLATAVSMSRYTGRNHFLSDVLIGSAIGYGTGCFVYHERHDPSLDVP